MHKFKELIVWQKSRILVTNVYKATNNFPKEELFGLTSQIRRCVISIPANITEGCGRATDKELCRFLDIANGSAFELETLLILSTDLQILTKEMYSSLNELLQEVQKLLYNFKKSKSI